MTLKVPSPFPSPRTIPLVAGTVLHRIHSNQFKGDEFNPGLGRPSRFAPLKAASGVVPTMYAANHLNCAIYETLLHDVPVGAMGMTLGWHRIDPSDHSELILTAPVLVAQLNEPDLKRMETTRRELLDSSPRHYRKTAAWAAALIDEHPHIAGLAWTSSKDDAGTSYVFFGARIPSGVVKVTESTSVKDCPMRLDAVRLACLRIGVSVVW